MKPVRSHTFRGKRFTVRFRYRSAKNDAITEFAPQTIRIAAGLSDHRFFVVAIHESLHAALPDMDESVVTETARDIAAFLKRLGYERTQS